MPTTCIHCETELTALDLAEGSCANCGRYVPQWLREQAKNEIRKEKPESEPHDAPEVAEQGRWGWVTVVGVSHLLLGGLLLAFGLWVMIAGADAIHRLFQVHQAAEQA